MSAQQIELTQLFGGKITVNASEVVAISDATHYPTENPSHPDYNGVPISVVFTQGGHSFKVKDQRTVIAQTISNLS